ncbi:hypothetical protein TRVA0_015S01310 [Trichomonascus vanleenenianus]|uniref:uncharacterized protein n=1 Tax=Trichomonascus vanleenenianus TaxID=2268995 RepID=UPI003EC9E52B
MSNTIISPPLEFSPGVLSTARAVLRAQATALTYLADLYEQSEETQNEFFGALQMLQNCAQSHGKVVITGMGKSYKIATKLSATMNSLHVMSAVLHPSDALHGDLGMVRANDVVLTITSSGRTHELITLLRHLPQGVKHICLTCQPSSPLACAADAVLSAHLPSEMAEKSVYGLDAPTVSTTACLAVGDALCITLAEMLETDFKQRRLKFALSHPGGAIGQSLSSALNSEM